MLQDIVDKVIAQGVRIARRLRKQELVKARSRSRPSRYLQSGNEHLLRSSPHHALRYVILFQSISLSRVL